MTTLRDYQVKQLAEVAELRRAGAEAVLIEAPTGSGKTVTFSEFAVREPAPIQFVAHRRELIKQARQKLDAAGAWLADVASVQTLAKHPDELDAVVIIDEAHHAVSPEYRRALARSRRFKLGLSATPERLDGLGLGRAAGGPFDAMVRGPSVVDLIAAGHLVRSRVFAPQHDLDVSAAKVRGGEFRAEDLEQVVARSCITGDAVAEYHERARGRRGVGFCVSVAEAHKAAEAFNAAGVPAAAVWGSMKEKARDDAFADLEAGRVLMLMSCALIDEGLDIPDIGAVVDMAPTMSLGRVKQRWGRGMRPAAGKADLIVLDLAGNAHRHGLPETPHDWTLEGRVKRETGAAAVVQCSTCYVMHAPGPRCPECGYDYAAARAAAQRREMRQVTGELAELTDADLRRNWLADAPIAELLQAARTHEELVEIAKARKYDWRWPDQRARFIRKNAPGLTGPNLEEFLA